MFTRENGQGWLDRFSAGVHVPLGRDHRRTAEVRALHDPRGLGWQGSLVFAEGSVFAGTPDRGPRVLVRSTAPDATLLQDNRPSGQLGGRGQYSGQWTDGQKTLRCDLVLDGKPLVIVSAQCP